MIEYERYSFDLRNEKIASLSVIESNRNLQWLQKGNPYFRTSWKLYYGRKTKESEFQFRAGIKSLGYVNNLSLT